MELLTEQEMREIAAEPMSHRERRIACTALGWLDLAKAAQAETSKAHASTIREVREALGAASGESVVVRAEAVEAVMAQINDARSILGATDGEMLRDAARRVADVAGLAASARHRLRSLLTDPPRGNVDEVAAEIVKGIAEIRETLNCPADVTLAVRASDVMAELSLLRDAAEAEPAQTFRPFMTITICPDRKGEPYASIDVPPIRDPAFLALSGMDLMRLALVVARE